MQIPVMSLSQLPNFTFYAISVEYTVFIFCFGETNKRAFFLMQLHIKLCHVLWQLCFQRLCVIMH